MIPKIMIILGSASDKTIAQKTIDMLEKLEIPYALKVASAHRTHKLLKDIIKKSTEAGVEVFIAIAGLSAHLPGVISSYTNKPVIGVPVEIKVNGLDALYSSVQTPYPVPVATVGMDRGENAAILAGQILAITDTEVEEKIKKLREEYASKVFDNLNIDFEGNFQINDFLNKNELNLKEPSNETDYDYCEDLDVAIIVGNHPDLQIAENMNVVLDRLKLKTKTAVVCPIRTPNKFEEYMESVGNAKLFIGVTSNSAQVTGAIASLTTKPVIGVPCSKGSFNYSLLSMVNMPPGMPVATVGINAARNAAFLAGEILSIGNEELIELLKKIKNKKNNL